MTPGQKRTALGCGGIVVGLVLLALGALWVEMRGVESGDEATISELFWLVWAHQPWVIFLGSHLVAAPVWYLLGHFTAQRKDVYDRIRAGLPAAVAVALLPLAGCGADVTVPVWAVLMAATTAPVVASVVWMARRDSAWDFVPLIAFFVSAAAWLAGWGGYWIAWWSR